LNKEIKRPQGKRLTDISPYKHGGGLRRRQDGLGFNAALELFVQPFDGIAGTG
jgi:hypothetical protein